jgi:predicted nucleic acid-binding protein
MNGSDFLDSNVLVYAYQFDHPEKQRIAHELVRGAAQGKAVVSTQVLAELATTLLHKFSPPVPCESVVTILDRLSPIRLIVPDAEIVRRAVEAHRSYGIRFYDGMIIAAAERAGCERVWSEDLNAGQKYFGIMVTNPFR